MNVLIVEDERIAYEKLKALLANIAPEMHVVGNARSIQEGIELLNGKSRIDLAFFDIQLEDGLSFSIFEQTAPNIPVIFTTAYDDYAIRAFDHYSIAYLLKPIQKTELKKALDKFKAMKPQDDYSEILLKAIRQAREESYKERFTVKVGTKIRLIDTKEVTCFYSREKGSYIFTNSGKHYLIDYSMDQLEKMVDPKQFHRINRKHIVNVHAIDRVIQYTNSRLKIALSPQFDEDIVVARERVKAFKKWLEGE